MAKRKTTPAKLSKDKKSRNRGAGPTPPDALAIDVDPNLRRSTRRSLKTAEVIAREIVKDISDRGLRPEDQLPPEASMVEHYGVGRASVREALRLLETQGLVRIKAGPGGGPIVGRATPKSLGRLLTLFLRLMGVTYEDLAEAMLFLEPILAEKAARRIEKSEFGDVLKASVDVTGGVLHDFDQAVAGLKNFHQLIYDAAGNRTLSLIAGAIGTTFAEHLTSSIDTSTFHPVAKDDHMAITDAVLGGRPVLARRLMEEHIERQIDFVRSRMPGMLKQLVEWR